jgi:hypothetical protein
MPLRPELRTIAMDHRRSFHVAALSPVQCATYAPLPGKVDLHHHQRHYLRSNEHIRAATRKGGPAPPSAAMSLVQRAHTSRYQERWTCITTSGIVTISMRTYAALPENVDLHLSQRQCLQSNEHIRAATRKVDMHYHQRHSHHLNAHNTRSYQER